MSKKHPAELWTLVRLTLAGALICFPRGVLLQPGPEWLQIPVCAALALCLANLLVRLGPVLAWLRPGLLLPIALPPLFALILKPDPIGLVFALLPFALLLNRLEEPVPSIRPPLRALGVFLILSIGATGLWTLSRRLPAPGLPPLPYNTFFWLGVDAVLLLGIASRRMLRPVAAALLRWQVAAFLVLLYLAPAGWTVLTSLKAPGEPARHFLETRPRPRYVVPSETDPTPLIPSGLAEAGDPAVVLRALDLMTWRLGDPALESVFADAPLPPPEMVRALKLYGYVLEDVHGNFVPEESFLRAPPPEIDPAYVPWIETALETTAFTPEELAGHLSLTPRDAEILLRRMRRLNLVDRIPGPDLRYRLTPQARHPFENGLYPRQILLALDSSRPDRETRISVRDYAANRHLPYEQKLAELDALVAAGALEMSEGPHFDAYTGLLEDAATWRAAGLFTVCALLALLVGRCLPTDLPEPSGVLLAAAAVVLLAPLPVAPFAQMCLATGWGLWMLRIVWNPTPALCTRATLFAAAALIPNLLPLALPAQSPLVRQAAWAVIWLVPALALLAFAVRPLPRES